MVKHVPPNPGLEPAPPAFSYRLVCAFLMCERDVIVNAYSKQGLGFKSYLKD